MSSDKGILFVVSGPSGSGKGTICSELSKIRNDVYISVSVTSRAPRTEDIEGKSYFFKKEEEIMGMIEKGELLEWVKYCNHYYGTPKANIDKKINEGLNVILEIEVIGALNVKKIYPESILVFVVPPSFEDLMERLRGRGSEDEKVIMMRINRAIEEMEAAEKYDYIVVNDTVETAVSKIQAVITSEKSKINRNQDIIKKFIHTLKEAVANDQTFN